MLATNPTTSTFTSPVFKKVTTIERSKRNFFSERFQRRTLIVDLLLLNLCLFAGMSLYPVDITINNWRVFLKPVFFVTVNVTWLTVAMCNDIYKWYEIIKPFKKVSSLLYVNGIFFAVLSCIYYNVFFPLLGSSFLLPTFLIFMVLSISSHLIFRKHYQRRMPLFKYAIVGGKPGSLNYIKDTYSDAYRGKSYCIGGFANDPTDNIRWLGDYSQLKRFILQNSFDKLFYIYSDLKKQEVRKIIELCESRFIDFEIVPREFDIIDGGMRVLNSDKLPTLAPKIEPLQRLRNKIVKRAFDILFSLSVILLIFPWLFPIIAILIKLESRGPIFFLQERTGYWNKPFQFIKFRSMTVNTLSDTKQATRNDARVTKIGNFLRKSSLDEMPQFFNVLMGDMSVVGPRPHMLKHTEEYSNLIDTYMVRHRVKPGITGWAQINGYRGPTETLNKMESRVEYDVHYMKNWTFLMDIRCVIFTVINMIRGEKNAL